MIEEQEQDAPAAEVARQDEDRWLAACLAPSAPRARLLALYAFHLQIARVRDLVSDPMIGAIRLQWWREAVEEAARRPAAVRRHPVALGLVGLFQGPNALSPDDLEAMIGAREAELDAGPPADMDALLAAVDATSGRLTAAAAQLLVGPPGEETRLALSATGRAWGLVGLVRAFGPLAAKDRSPIPETVRVGARLRRSEMATGENPEAARAALGALIGAAQQALGEARGRAREIPAQAWPAVGYVALAAAYLTAAGRPDRDPYRDPVTLDPLSRRVRLVWSSLSGRL